ncbi:MAG: hypothetical protein RIT45_1688 [Pseudomonadota bacterium]
MAELVPIPFARLVASMLRSLAHGAGAFDVPHKAIFRTPEGLDFGRELHGGRIATPFGPAAGPHAQMAQNIAMAWLVGARFVELKTVQVMDTLEIPRPCIDVPNLGFNVEWSQELRVPQSLEEYVKGSMLVDILVSQSTLSPQTWLLDRPLLELSPGDADTVFDMSVGYDLAGIRGEKVRGFLDGMRDASAVIERLRAEIPDAYAPLRTLDYRREISRSVTLSTFHGCPPSEVEAIGEFLIDAGLHTIIKLNPTLLGPARLRAILHDHLGYDELHVPDAAFAEDMQPDQAFGILERLSARAAAKGVGFGAKMTNTLVVENHRGVFPASEQRMYLSGAPLHVLASTIAVELRERFGDRLHYSFSAGIEAGNFADALTLGLAPVTSCTDLLKKGGYSRASKYFARLQKTMQKSGARTIDDHVVLGGAPREQAAAMLTAIDAPAAVHGAFAAGATPTEAAAAAPDADAVLAAWTAHAAGVHGAAYKRLLLETDAYAKARLPKPPPKPGTQLWTFDCLTCDICVPVCPNDANFRYDLDRATVPVQQAIRSAEGWKIIDADAVAANKPHQIANFADLCNECGNCDTFCPDLGGPYVLKPRFFGSLEEWQRWREHDGFYVGGETISGRFEGIEVHATPLGTGRYRYVHPSATVEVDLSAGTVQGEAETGVVVDLTYLHLLDTMRVAVAKLHHHPLAVPLDRGPDAPAPGV